MKTKWFYYGLSFLISVLGITKTFGAPLSFPSPPAFEIQIPDEWEVEQTDDTVIAIDPDGEKAIMILSLPVSTLKVDEMLYKQEFGFVTSSRLDIDMAPLYINGITLHSEGGVIGEQQDGSGRVVLSWSFRLLSESPTYLLQTIATPQANQEVFTPIVTSLRISGSDAELRKYTEALMNRFVSGIDMYVSENDEFPYPENVFQTLAEMQAYNDSPNDAWGTPFNYATYNYRQKFQLVSYGADRKEGGDDDIVYTKTTDDYPAIYTSPNQDIMSMVDRNLLNAVQNQNLNEIQNALESGATLTDIALIGAITEIGSVNNGGAFDVVQFLIEQGANVNARCDSEALNSILLSGMDNVLLSQRTRKQLEAYIRDQHRSGSTALMYAIVLERFDIAQLLLENGADVDIREENGQTMLINVASQGHVDRAKMLLEYGANVDHQSKNGSTALIGAAFNGHIEIVKLLLEYKADVNLRNEYGKTAIDYAREEGHVEIVNVLKAAGA